MSITQVMSDTEKLKAVERLNEECGKLVAKGEAIEVSDPNTCLLAKQFENDSKSYMVAVDNYADPDITAHREIVSRLVTAKKMLLQPVLDIVAKVRTARKVWEEAERVRTEAEQKQYDKKGVVVEIKPSIPTLPGVPSRRYYKVKVSDPDKLLEAWAVGRNHKSRENVYNNMIIRGFITIDEAAVRASASTKEKWEELKGRNIPGLEFYTE